MGIYDSQYLKLCLSRRLHERRALKSLCTCMCEHDHLICTYADKICSPLVPLWWSLSLYFLGWVYVTDHKTRRGVIETTFRLSVYIAWLSFFWHMMAKKAVTCTTLMFDNNGFIQFFLFENVQSSQETRFGTWYTQPVYFLHSTEYEILKRNAD